QLQMDLVEAIGVQDGETRPDVYAMDPIEETRGKTKVQESGRAGIEPIGWQPEIPRNPRTRGDERFGERIRRNQLTLCQDADNINVACDAGHQSQRHERRATDDDQLESSVGVLELLGEGSERGRSPPRSRIHQRCIPSRVRIVKASV
ncbi:MAG: hypothetical protein WEA54_00075, partial [Actinomycetota bacterium]